MKQTLESFLIGPLTGVGASPKVRVYADSPFIASTHEYHPAGDEATNYTEISLTAEGSNWRFPNTTFDTTDDSSDPNVTCSAVIVDSLGKPAQMLWEGWTLPASFGASVTFGALEVFNTHRAPLRDTETYSKVQINLLLAALVTPLTIKAAGVATLVGGTAEVVEAAVGASSKVLLTGKTEGVMGPLWVRDEDITPGVGFTITSNNEGDEGYVVWIIV